MRLPRTLFGRNVLLILILIVFGQLCGALLFRQLVQQPRIAQISSMATGHLGFLKAVMEATDDAGRDRYVAALNSVGGTEISRQAPPSADEAPWFDPIATSFATMIARALHLDPSEMRWQLAEGGTLWLPAQINDSTYWIGVRNMLTDRGRWLLWFGLTGLTTALALCGAYLIQRRINRPLAQLVAAADAVARGDRPARLAEDAPSEIAVLAKRFNQMTHSLEEIDRERTLMLAGVSHDLRTPLTKLQLGLEIVRDRADPELIASMERSLAEMDGVIDQFMDYARAGNEEPREPVDLNALVRECAQDYARRGHVWQLDLGELPTIELRLRSIERVLSNLIENALKYGAAGYSICTRRDGQFVELCVRDSGPGIPEADLVTMKQAFVRGSTARGGQAGAGLGLAIVDRIARGHGGELTLRSRDGGGLAACVTLSL